MADLHILCRMCTVEGVAAPSGRCLRSGHKNSVKGKGAIKHKGAPTIIYHCTDAPFRLAPLATHPLSGGGQEKDGCPLPSRSARHPPPEWGWARKRWIPPSVSLRSPPTPLSGGGQEKHGFPLPSRSTRHPPPKWGWARKTWRQGRINANPCLPR